MVVVIGGAFQGKLDYVREAYEVGETDIFYAENGGLTLEIPQRVIYGVEHLIAGVMEDGQPAEDWIRKRQPDWEDKIVICEDISCGVVPVDPKLRRYREAVGRSMVFLCARADSVVRVFCGIGKVLK